MKKLLIFTAIVVIGIMISAMRQRSLVKEEIALVQKTYTKAHFIRNNDVDEEKNETDNYDDYMFFKVRSWFWHSNIYKAIVPSKTNGGVTACTFEIVDGKAKKDTWWGDPVFN